MSMAHLAESTAIVDPMQPRFARVDRVHRESADVWTLEIETPDGFAFAPGQFNMLYAFGVGEAAISISGDPTLSTRLVHTIRAVGKVSAALAHLKAGETIGVRGPYGKSWPVAAARGSDVVVIAGGLGLAPLRPALYHLFANRDAYGRIVLLYGSRSPDDLIFRHEVEHWRQRLDLDIEVTVDHAASGWHGNVGVVTTLIARAAFDPANTVAMMCGPEVMMRFCAAALMDAGVAESAIHVSMERNMKCAIGQCGHCQFLTSLVCRDGPVYGYDRVRKLMAIREI